MTDKTHYELSPTSKVAFVCVPLLSSAPTEVVTHVTDEKRSKATDYRQIRRRECIPSGHSRPRTTATVVKLVVGTTFLPSLVLTQNAKLCSKWK